MQPKQSQDTAPRPEIQQGTKMAPKAVRALFLTVMLAITVLPISCAAFHSHAAVNNRLYQNQKNVRAFRRPSILFSSDGKDDLGADTILFSSDSKDDLGGDAGKRSRSEKEIKEGAAVTKTINERLIEEVREATEQEKFGARSSIGKKLGLDSFRSEKTDEERQAAIEEARNLNGVNPLVALTGAAFSLAAAGGLWALTIFLAEYFTLHPVESDAYFIQRAAAVFRNVVMGLVSLASGFFGVTGLGIMLLGVRVGYGVMTGELDPTPIKRSKQEELDMPNVWDLMMNKKPGRRR